MAHDAMTLEAEVRVELDGFTLDVSLSIDPGRTTAIVGPNGAGKTTLLRALAGLRTLSAGRIVLDGVALDDASRATYVPPERRPVGVVFQDNLLFPHLDALDNVAFGLRTQGRRRRDARREGAHWLDRVGLEGREHARPSQLSGGQAQRVALARALAPSPRLLLLDEPLAALDATTRNEVRRDLRRHLATFPGVRVLVTHDPVDAAVLADDVLVLDDGRIVQAGTPGEITARPRTRWVAALTGTNLFAGVVDEAGSVSIEGGGMLVMADRIHPGPVFAAVHPRAVTLHRLRPEGSQRNTWRGAVADVEPVGDRFRVRVDANPPVVAEITAASVRDLGLVEGADVWVAVKATEIDTYPA
ncbi:MAG TPA: ABC transporter ATP-binding protein [Acidimicrobiales bacterium]|jgi:molybdate transport system ATP-binding protein|nr:ABC transporter ATP-binding protein [Acidimicrobiales bacterium]